jgi:MYXO-CTERM domain-containing protein
MRTQTFIVSMVGVVAAAALAGSASADFGVLNYNGTPGGNIPFTVGNAAAIGNDGYTFSNHTSGASVVTIGLKAIAWQGANFNLDSQANGGDITYSTVAAGGSWLNRDSGGTYLAATGAATQTRDGSGNIVAYTGGLRSRWSFVWNASQDGLRPAAGLFNLRMVIDGPAAGVLSMDLGDLSTDFNAPHPITGALDPKWQNAWNSGFSFLSSAGTVYDYGNWNIKLQVFSASGDGYTSLVGEQAINVMAVPAPGVAALLGLAGAFGHRRRRN